MQKPFVFLWQSVPLLLAVVLSTGNASAATFKDVPKSNSAYIAVEDMKQRGIMAGYSDGTFRPDAKVTRAEALKVIVAAKGVSTDELKAFVTSSFKDVPKGSWYLPSVEWARQKLSLIDGPPKSISFHPDRTVRKAEFLKILLLSQEQDPQANADVSLPLAPDVTDVQAWYYSFIRLALSTSVTEPNVNGFLGPDRELTRADIALFTERLLLFKEGKRTQNLLSSIEKEAVTVMDAFNDKQVKTAEYASARALLDARGAKVMVPDEPIVNGALKVAEGYRALVRGYRAQTEKKYDEAAKLYKDAWSIGKTAMEVSPAAKTYATSIQKSAQQLAEEVRLLKKK